MAAVWLKTAHADLIAEESDEMFLEFK